MRQQPSKAGGLRVCIVPEYPLNLMAGGLQVQAEETCAEVAAGGDIRCELFDWSSRRPPADVYHFIGLPPHMMRIAELVAASGRPYLVTLLLGAPSPGAVRLATARSWLKAAVARERSLRSTLQAAAHIITITEAEAQAAVQICDLDPQRLAVVPHGVAAAFFQRNPQPWQAVHGVEPFVLCAGAIQPRKNQLLLAQAANALRLPLVLIGPVLPGAEGYAEQVGVEMKRNEPFGGCWIRGLDRGDPLLVAAHHACRLFALLSAEETQPISVLQAMAAARPVLLLRAAYTRQAPFAQLACAPDATLSAVRTALQQAWAEAMPTRLTEDFAWPNVAAKLRGLYQGAAQHRQAS
jgi:glycosyltransferase involved in cell wall biosynthesis